MTPWWKEMSRYQWVVLAVAWLGWVFDVMDSALFQLAKQPLLTDLLGGAAAYKSQGKVIEGQIQMLFIVGWAVGGVIFGVVADRMGRSKVLIYTILVYCAFTGFTALCQSWQQVAAIRFVSAIGIGGEWAAGAALVAEVVPNRARVGAAAILQTAAAFGPILAALANQLLAAQSWRWLFVVGILPALLTVIIRTMVKEPERWTNRVKSGGSGWLDPIRELFKVPRWRRNAIVAMIVGLVGIAGAGTVTFWLPNLVDEASVGVLPEVVAARKSMATYAGHLGTLVGVLMFPWLCDLLGRKRALFTFFVLTPLALILMLFTPLTYEALLWKAPIVNFCAIGLTAGFGLYFPELFPTRLRATGSGFAYNVARIGQAPIPVFTGYISQAANSTAIGVLTTGAIYLFGILAIPFAKETKGQGLIEDEDSQ